MATEPDCIAALTAMFGAVPAGLHRINASKGYLYQAVVFDALARFLVALPPYSWTVHHPGGVRTYAYMAGASTTAAIDNLSRCSHANGTDHLVQGLTVTGRSTVTHHLDVTKLRIVGPRATWPANPSGAWVRMTLECKNTEDGVTLGTARELVGLEFDVIRWWDPHFVRTCLVSAQPISPQAETLMRFYGVEPVASAAPTSWPVWAIPLASWLDAL